MRASVNHHLYTQTSLDSGALTMLGAVIHRFPERGDYLGVAVQGRQRRSFRLTVDDDSPAMQANIDLATLDSPPTRGESDCGKDEGAARGRHFVVNPKGYALFHVSRGRGGYAVRVGRSSEREEGQVFDSAELQSGDLFAVTLIRPGTYSVANLPTEARGEIVVAYPRIEGGERRQPEPVYIECTEGALRPDRIHIEPAQGQVYRFRTPSRIAIELVRPDDGPEPPRGPGRTTRWRRPTRP